MSKTALRYLEKMYGPDSRFRDGQLEAIEEIIRNRSRVLLVQRTGWGKKWLNANINLNIILTTATVKLMEKGCCKVYPFTLAAAPTKGNY